MRMNSFTTKLPAMSETRAFNWFPDLSGNLADGSCSVGRAPIWLERRVECNASRSTTRGTNQSRVFARQSQASARGLGSSRRMKTSGRCAGGVPAERSGRGNRVDDRSTWKGCSGSNSPFHVQPASANNAAKLEGTRRAGTPPLTAHNPSPRFPRPLRSAGAPCAAHLTRN